MAFRSARCLLLLLLAAGCDPGGSGVPPGTEGAPCSSGSDCEGSLACVDAVCTMRTEADAGGDRIDGGPGPMDSGPTCAAENRCGTGCCEAGEECIDDACLPPCESGLRCGAASTCCAAEQLCLSDACVTPGDPCDEAIDCPVDGYCDPGLGRCLPTGEGRCEYFPPAGVFEPEQEWAWTGSTVRPANVQVMMAPAVGDVTGDGVPEVVFNTYNASDSYQSNGVLRIVRGDNGEEVVNIESPVICPMFGVALGDLNGDGTPEIVTGMAPCDAMQVVAFAPDGTEVWRSRTSEGAAFTGNFGFGAPTLADLEGDGMAEVVVGSAILEHDGTLRVQPRAGAGSNCCGTVARSPLSAVYDADGDGDLELISGNAVWHHDGTPLWEDASLPDGYVAVADFYGDGIVDIAVVHQQPAAGGVGHVSIRRATDGMVLMEPVILPGGGRGGPPTIADFDGDGLPEIAVAGAGAYAVFDPDGEYPDGTDPVAWSRTTQDNSSNVTGSSVFDFDGDGSAEVVYNDECYMRVYSGVDGSVLAEVPQNSHTLVEYPLIVDVDADGNAEIVFAANAAVNRCSTLTDWDGLQAGIRVFRDAADNWVGTRPVWNQHSYHITNVRPDLSIPSSEQPNWERFNNFRQNSQSFDAPNLVVASVAASGVGCPTTLTLTATVRNDGAVTVGAGLPVTFYAGSEASPGRVFGTARTTAPLPPGATETVTLELMPEAGDIGSDLPFFVRVDDVGDGTGENNECQEDDNVSAGLYSCTSIE